MTDRAPPTASAGAFVSAALRAMNDDVTPAAARVAAGAGKTRDDEAIHDMRVAIRRLRTALKLARPIYSRFYADAARAGLTVVHRATGALRDEEVLEETLESLGVDDPDFVAWRKRRTSRERALRRAVLARLAEGELERACAMVSALVTLPVKPSRDRDLAKLARKSVARAQDGVERLRDTPTGDVEGLHALRIAYKQLRYTVEIFTPALPEDLAALGKPAAHFQKRLGEIHDLDVARVSVERARGLAPQTRDHVLAALEQARIEAIRKYQEMRGVTGINP